VESEVVVATELVLVDDPIPGVRRFTLNRPEKRNALSNELRGELFDRLREADSESEARVVVIRGAGPCFSAGYDLQQAATDNRVNLPRHAANVTGFWARHLIEGWFEMWDYATPVIAQVHGWCLAGGSELAAACDLVYVAEDARIGYPPVRTMSPPDMVWQPWLMGMRRGMEAMLTGDAISGTEAAAIGVANRAYPEAELGERVLEIAARIALIDPDLLALNKRVIHRSMEAMGIRAGLRATTDVQAIGVFQPGAIAHRTLLKQDVKSALSSRDRDFGDYREGAGASSGTTSGAAPGQSGSG
jgi:enoyl-CoA hydratase